MLHAPMRSASSKHPQRCLDRSFLVRVMSSSMSWKHRIHLAQGALELPPVLLLLRCQIVLLTVKNHAMASSWVPSIIRACTRSVTTSCPLRFEVTRKQLLAKIRWICALEEAP